MKDGETANSSSKPHAINLRVMRLVDPLPTTTNPPLINLEKAFSDASLQEKEGVPCGVGTLSVLPSSFGAVHGSEVFRSLISLFNKTSGPLKISSLIVDLQTSSMRTISVLKMHDPCILQSKHGFNKVACVALRETGTHVLTCAATYMEGETSRMLRQFFRFNVLPPNTPKQTASLLCHSPYHNPDPNYFTSPGYHSLVELRMINNSSTTIYVLGTDFMPKAPFQFSPCLRQELPVENEATENQTVANPRTGRYATLNKGDICTVTFQVRFKGDENPIHEDGPFSTPSAKASPLTESETDSLPYTVDSTAISSPSLMTLRDPELFKRHDFGRVSVSWRSALGEKGLLRTSLMMSEPKPQQSGIEVCISSVPRRIYVHRTFTARCQVRNNSDKSARLYLQVRRDLVGEIVPVGVSGMTLGVVSPGDRVDCAIPMIPLGKGLHSLSGFRVIDVESNVIYKAKAASVTVL